MSDLNYPTVYYGTTAHNQSLQTSAASLFSVEVIDYFVGDDANFYQSHIFILQLFLEQHEFKLMRSYASFIELDHKLRKQYPRSPIPQLQLSGTTAQAKRQGQRGNMSFNNIRGSISSSSNIDGNNQSSFRESSVGSSLQAVGVKRLTRRVDANEAIPQKKTLLTKYLKDLLQIPEVMLSETFMQFLDEEAVDGEVSSEDSYSEDMLENLEIILLLQEEQYGTKNIKKELSMPLGVVAGSVVVWTFETKQHDIGFSVTFEGQDIYTYQRYNSHEKPVRGCYEVQTTGTLVLLWDNSYSKWRSKLLSYVFRVVDWDLYETIKIRAAGIRKEKLILAKQRVNLKRVLSRLSVELMSSTAVMTNAAALSALTAAEDKISLLNVSNANIGGFLLDEQEVKKLLEDIEILKNEKKCLQQALSESETALVTERGACAKIVQQVEDLQILKDQLEEELKETSTENDSLRCELNQLLSKNDREERVSFSIEDLLDLPDDEIIPPAVAMHNFDMLLTHTKSLQQSLTRIQDAYKQLDQQSSKWKTDKKQLKSAAIQLKEKLDIAEKKLMSSEHEKLLLEGETETLHSKIRSYENQIRLLQRELFESQSYPPQSNIENGSSELTESSPNATQIQISSEELKSAALAQYNDEVIQSLSSEDNPNRIIVHDFAKAEPDEISQYLNEVTSTIMDMMPSWDSIIGNDEDYSPSAHTVPTTVDKVSASSNDQSSSRMWPSSLRNMSFGF